MLEIFTYFADWIAYGLLSLERGTKLADAVHFFIEDTTKIFFLLALMIYIIGFARSFVSPEKVRVWLTGKSRFTGYVLAALLGALTPFCSCSSVPLFIAFLSAGIPLGVTELQAEEQALRRLTAARAEGEESVRRAMINAAFHKRADIETAIASAAHTLEYLPAYSPDLNPIEHKWSQSKTLRRTHQCSVNDIFTLFPL